MSLNALLTWFLDIKKANSVNYMHKFEKEKWAQSTKDLESAFTRKISFDRADSRSSLNLLKVEKSGGPKIQIYGRVRKMNHQELNDDKCSIKGNKIVGGT